MSARGLNPFRKTWLRLRLAHFERIGYHPAARFLAAEGVAAESARSHRG